MKENKCGERIKQRLSELNISQADLCRKTGINRATMSQYISGKYYPTQKRIEDIADALNTTPAFLMGWASEQPGYSYAAEGQDDISQLLDIALGLDDATMEQLINYAKYLSKEEKK